MKHNHCYGWELTLASAEDTSCLQQLGWALHVILTTRFRALTAHACMEGSALMKMRTVTHQRN